MNEDSPALEGVLAVFTMEWKATHALERLQEASAGGAFELVAGAIMVKDSEGNLAVTKTLELTPKEGAKRGAVVGGILGVVFPAGLLAGAAVGAIAGATVGHFQKLGFADDYLEQLDEELKAGRTALLVVVDEADAMAVIDALDDYSRIDRQPIRHET
jgi:uncharacterized membrane protein